MPPGPRLSTPQISRTKHNEAVCKGRRTSGKQKRDGFLVASAGSRVQHGLELLGRGLGFGGLVLGGGGGRLLRLRHVEGGVLDHAAHVRALPGTAELEGLRLEGGAALFVTVALACGAFVRGLLLGLFAFWWSGVERSG